jgi:hypothetical protein
VTNIGLLVENDANNVYIIQYTFLSQEFRPKYYANVIPTVWVYVKLTFYLTNFMADLRFPQLSLQRVLSSGT